jgi:hypothetical protein
LGRAVTCDVCLQWSDVCRGTTTTGLDWFGDRVRITTIEFVGGESSTGVVGVLLVLIDDEDIAGIVTVRLPIVVVVVWLSFNLLRNVLLNRTMSNMLKKSCS